MCAQCQGELRLRSTPRAFFRVPAAQPSGLARSMTQMAVCAGGLAKRNRCVMASPEGSSPWTQATTNKCRVAEAGPILTARIARPRTEWPMTSACRGGTGAAAFGVGTSDQRPTDAITANSASWMPTPRTLDEPPHTHAVCRTRTPAGTAPRGSRDSSLGDLVSAFSAAARFVGRALAEYPVNQCKEFLLAFCCGGVVPCLAYSRPPTASIV
jgi:hypothetical protein